MHSSDTGGKEKPAALALLAGHRPRNVGWKQAAGLLFGDWGTSRLYVLGLAFFFAGRASFYLILAMNLLILGVGWAYTQICRIYPDGGGVYTAAKQRSRILAVVGALLLFADYVVTASLSSLDAFRYFGLPQDTPLFAINSPGLWAIGAIGLIGLFNLMGPKHTGAFAIFAAVGMAFITILITVVALPQVKWQTLPHVIGAVHESPKKLWIDFVAIVLALSGVEAIANLTGVMKKPVAHTARKAIWIVAIEVAVFNFLLAIAMVASPLDAATEAGRAQYKDDMMAFLSFHYVGLWAEYIVRIVGGLLLLSATNTAVTDMISVQYLMARDNELPAPLQGLNRFGVPWLPAVVAAGVPVLVLLFAHDVETLAALYAIGVIGAVAINVSLCAMHPRLRRMRRKAPMLALGCILLAIWITLALTKMHALIFVTIVMAVGLSARQINKMIAKRRPKVSLLRQAIMEQLTPEALLKPKLLVGTYGSEALAEPAIQEAKRSDAALVVCFIREVTLSYKYESEQKLTIDTDPAAIKVFSRYLELGHAEGVPIIPVYDTGPDAVELMAEMAAINGCERVLIGSSRKGVIYHLIKGRFQRRLEALLPPEIPVQVLAIPDTPESAAA